MMIRKKIQRVPRAPKVSTGIRIEGSSQKNQVQLVSGEYYPDRTMVPLVLQPYCSYTDTSTGKHIDNAMPEVINGCWYRLDASNRSLGLCEATKISVSQTGTDANGDVISVFSVASTPGAADYGRLTIRENVPAGEDITYIFAATLSTDGSSIREYFHSKCNINAEIPDILFDNNPTALYDPINGAQYYSINPSLTIDVPVTWKWKSYHELEGGWVDACSTQLDWCIELVGNGVKIDRQRMPDMVLLLVIAEVTVDGVTVQVEKQVSHTRRLQHLTWEITRVGDLPEDVTEISPYALIRSGSDIITDTSEVMVNWLNSSGTVIAEGINPTIPLSRLNADMYLGLDVRDRGGRVAITDDGKLIVDGQHLILTRSKA